MKAYPDYDRGQLQCFRINPHQKGATVLKEDDRPHNFENKDTSLMFLEQDSQKYLFLCSEQGKWHGQKISNSQYNMLKNKDFEEIAEYYYLSL